MQPALLRQEAGQAAGIGRGRLALGRLQQQPVAVGVAAEVEEGDAVPVAGVLEDVEDVAGRGVLAQHQLAVAALLGRGQRPLHLPRLLRQVAQVARPVVAVVGEGEEEDGCGDGHWFAPVLIRPRGLYVRHKGLRINAVATELAAVSQPAVQLIQLGSGGVQVTRRHMIPSLTTNRVNDIGWNERFLTSWAIVYFHLAIPLIRCEVTRDTTTDRSHQVRHVYVPDAGGVVASTVSTVDPSGSTRHSSHLQA